MADTESATKSPQILPWVLALLVIGILCAGVTYLLTYSLNMSALFAGLVLLSLCLGWWASAAFRDEIDIATPTTGTTSKVKAYPVYDGDKTSDAPDSATQFARVAIEATPNPVIIIDKLGRIVISNAAARQRFSITLEQARFTNVVRRPDLIDAIERVLVDRTPCTLALETRLPIDRYERVSIAAFDAHDEPYILVTVLDETEARMSERMRADFLANASHELRTPLAAIIGFIETLRGPAREDTKAREQFLEVMHVQADRMSRLISDLLSLSRIELNERVPPTALSDIASATLEAVDGLTPEKKQRVRVNSESLPTWVLGDRDEMAQVMVNLIDNALKYSAAGSIVTISVFNGLTREAAIETSMRQWENGARLPLTSPELERGRVYSVVRVENKGEGIERQFLPRLSERFFRIEDTASGKSGTGLGLAIVKHIVSRHRGGLVVESELGKGSAFSVYLPQPFEPEEATVT